MLARMLAAGVLAAALAAAQPRGIGEMGGDEMGGMGGAGRGSRGMGSGMGDGMGGGMPRGPQRQSQVEVFLEKLKLNKDQKDAALKILADAAEKSATVANQIRNGRQQIATAFMQKKSADEMKPLMDAYTAACAQMTAAEADAFGKIYATLKPNQQKNAVQAFELMGGLLIPQSGGRGMGMARQGRN